MRHYMIDDMNYIGKCVICGRQVTKDESYSNQYKNIVCVGCAEELANHAGVNTIKYVCDYIHGGDKRCAILHSCTVVFNRHKFDKPKDISSEVQEYMMENYNFTEEEIYEILDKYMDTINAKEIPVIW